MTANPHALHSMGSCYGLRVGRRSSLPAKLADDRYVGRQTQRIPRELTLFAALRRYREEPSARILWLGIRTDADTTYLENLVKLRSKYMLGSAAALFALLWTTCASSASLRAGESLKVGQHLYSDNNRYYAVLLADGNFAVFVNDGSARAVWATWTGGRGVTQAVLHHGGNFVLYTAANIPVWETKTGGAGHIFTVTELGQAMVLAPGRPRRNEPGPGTAYFRQGYKPVFKAKEYDRIPASSGKSGPYCVGDPHACGDKLHGNRRG